MSNSKLQTIEIKSLFKSKIFWTIVVGVTTAVTPLMVSSAERGEVKPHEVISMLSAGLIAGAGIYARTQPGNISSGLPIGLPPEDEGGVLLREIEPPTHE